MNKNLTEISCTVMMPIPVAFFRFHKMGTDLSSNKNPLCLNLLQAERIYYKANIIFSCFVLKLTSWKFKILRSLKNPSKTRPFCTSENWENFDFYSHSMGDFWLCRYVVVTGILAFEMQCYYTGYFVLPHFCWSKVGHGFKCDYGSTVDYFFE